MQLPVEAMAGRQVTCPLCKKTASTRHGTLMSQLNPVSVQLTDTSCAVPVNAWWVRRISDVIRIKTMRHRRIIVHCAQLAWESNRQVHRAVCATYRDHSRMPALRPGPQRECLSTTFACVSGLVLRQARRHATATEGTVPGSAEGAEWMIPRRC